MLTEIETYFSGNEYFSFMSVILTHNDDEILLTEDGNTVKVRDVVKTLEK